MQYEKIILGKILLTDDSSTMQKSVMNAEISYEY